MKTIEEIRAAFQKIHKVASNQSDAAYMSIPADPERDADLIVAAAIDELEKLRAEAKEILSTLRSASSATETLFALAQRGTVRRLEALVG